MNFNKAITNTTRDSQQVHLSSYAKQEGKLRSIKYARTEKSYNVEYSPLKDIAAV